MADIPPVSSNSATSSEELNPLLNPLLEHNLSRWAHVYFTTPPDRRDQAVRELLRELRSEPQASAHSEAADAPAGGPVSESVICPACGRSNRAGERFCGFCGAPFDAEPIPTPPAQATVPTPPAQGTEEPVGETFSFLGLAPDTSGNHADGNLEFLREKSFGSSYYEPEEESHRGRIFLVAALLVLVGLTYVSLPYLRSHVPAMLQRYQASAKAPASPAPPPPVQAEPHATQPTPTAGLPTPAGNAQQSSSEQASESQMQPRQAPGEDASAGVAAPKSAADSVTLASKAEPDAAADNGSRELSQAQRYLDGRGVPHDSGQAVALLWKAVGKQNTHAEILLADLYMLGDGVSKSCDQARLLLVAATKKGAPEAAEKLRSLESNGCP